jgi:hypothetical protein
MFSLLRIVITALATSVSPWSPAEWTVTLNIGREPGTYMPEDWAASGGRLVLPLEVLVESEYYQEDNNKNEDYLGTNALRLSVLEDPAFISSKGQETVKFEEEGAWKISFRRSGKVGDASKLRFWLDVAAVPEDDDDNDTDEQVAARRNDVTLPAGERLYFVANCWRQGEELDKGRARFRPIQQAYEQAQQVLEQRLSHETGDRRLDGTNPMDTVKASLDMAAFVKNRDDRMRELRDAERVLPSPDINNNNAGAWPGTDERLVIASGQVGIKRKMKGLLTAGEEFVILGTWTAKPSDLWEVVDDGDAEEETEDVPLQ